VRHNNRSLIREDGRQDGERVLEDKKEGYNVEHSFVEIRDEGKKIKIIA
jgi:hypothetical protein